MRDEKNARVREKYELSLDGRQIASIVVGALVILGVVFVLGLNVGRQVATRQAVAARAGDLEALDRAPSPAAPPVDGASLTFHDRLVKQKPPVQPQVTPVAVTSPTSTPTPTVVQSGSPEAGHPERSEAASAAERSRGTPTATATGLQEAGHPERSEAASAAERSRGTPAPTATAPREAAHPERSEAASAAERSRGTPSGAFTIQIGATQERAEADRIAARYRSLRPRVEAADVQGKGRWYRVRVGSFDTREAAERYRRDVSRETGVAGYVTASR